jgi:hypothetical protein
MHTYMPADIHTLIGGFNTASYTDIDCDYQTEQRMTFQKNITYQQTLKSLILHGLLRNIKATLSFSVSRINIIKF